MDPMHLTEYNITPMPYSAWALVPALKVKRLHPEAQLPTRANKTDAGLDLYSIEEKVLAPGARAIIKTGISVEFPGGYGLFIWDRSGLSTRNGLHRLAGVVDSLYRGEVGVALINLGQGSYTIKVGDKIAQAILAPIALPTVIEVDELSDTTRGEGGFGSTGR